MADEPVGEGPAGGEPVGGALAQVAEAMSSPAPGALHGALGELGSGDWEQLSRLIGGQAVRRVRDDHHRSLRAEPTGWAVLLPGVMGSDLAVVGDDGVARVLWFAVKELATGGLEKLALPRTGKPKARIQAGGVMRFFYLPLQMRLSQGRRTVLFPYDWRLPIGSTAAALAEWIRPLVDSAPVDVVAHSMGGLVSRALIAADPQLWGDMKGRLVMLGTPNRGSFLPALVFSGATAKLRLMALLDPLLDRMEVARVLATFPALYEMLPSAEAVPAAARLYERAAWPAGRGRAGVHQELLDAACAFQKSIAGSVDPERMVYVAGYGHRTVDDVDVGKRFRWRVSRRGDGTVPHALGVLDGVPTWWSGARHGALPRDEGVLRAVVDLLDSGRTTALESGPEPPLSRDESEEVWVDEVEDPGLAGTGAHGVATPGRPYDALGDLVPVDDPESVNGGDGASLRIVLKVAWGDIAQAPDSAIVAVGHYEGVYPTAAEAAVDSGMSGDSVPREQRILYQATARGSLRGTVGSTTAFPWPSRERPERTVLVMGMGRPGTFGWPEHEVLVRNMLWTADAVYHAPVLDTVLIGAGAGNLPVGQTVRSFVQAVRTAARAGELDGSLGTVRFVERELGRARRIHELLGRILEEAAAPAPVALEVGPLEECPGGTVSEETALSYVLLARFGEDLGSAPAAGTWTEAMVAGVTGSLGDMRKDGKVRPDAFEVRRPLVSDDATGEVPTRFSLLVRDGELRVSAISDAATVSERPLGIEPEVFEALVQYFELDAGGDPDKAGDLLRRLAVLDEFQGFLRENRRTVLEVDPFTARLPWEVLKVGESSRTGSSFLGLSAPVARQLRTTASPPPAVTGRRVLNRVLLIGSPGPGGELGGVAAEVQAAREVLTQHNVAVDVLLDAEGVRVTTRANVLRHLIPGGYDVVHYAGHGRFSADDPSTSGWVLADGLFRGRYLPVLGDNLAPLVVANACHSARLSTGLAGLADDFMSHGVRNLVGTTRAVSDAGAAEFVGVFYRVLLGVEGSPPAATPASLGAAVLAGRIRLHDKGIADWDAYVLYGDADFRFHPKAGGA